MDVRFENLRMNCEKCGKPAKWKCYERQSSDFYISEALKVHHLCDKCKKEN